MELNNYELEIIREALMELRTSDAVFALSKKIDKQLTKHDWKMLGSPRMFDDNYKCTRCGAVDSESADSSYTKPEFGCVK